MYKKHTSEIESAVELNKVSKFYPGTPVIKALSDISLSVNSGEFVGIVGSSGSGKSTLLHVIGTLTRPSEGSVNINGLNTAGMSDSDLSGLRAKFVGFVFQDFFLLSGISARENVEQGLLYSGAPAKARRERSEMILERVGLSNRMGHFPNEMSGGEQQRVAIARALVHNPAFVLADEPTGNLDSKNSNAIMDLLTTLNKDGATVILITHDLEVAALTKRQIVLEDGRINSDSNFVSRE
tara:strand:- start:927 stop:1643 length:717 start_codon:yes stop_codon:yes gene_type:complete